MDARGSLWPAVPIVVDANAATLKSFLSLAAVNGRPAVAYTARTPSLSLQQLMFKMASDASGTSFATAAAVVVVPAVNVQYTSLAVVNGRPALAYYDPDATGLRYMRASDGTGASWPSTPVAVTSASVHRDAGRYANLLVVAGNPAIVYYSDASTSLVYVRASDVNGGAWPARGGRAREASRQNI